MLDNIGLIQMNGRIQDPLLGRFASADPYIAEPGLTQNYNRYSYLFNNPLSFIDPSGFCDQNANSDSDSNTSSNADKDHGRKNGGDTGISIAASQDCMEEVVVTAHQCGDQCQQTVREVLALQDAYIKTLNLDEIPARTIDAGGLVGGQTGEEASGKCGPTSIWPHGGGIYGSGGAEAGVGDAGAAATVSAGRGGFVDSNGHVSSGQFLSGGTMAYAGEHAVGAPTQTATPGAGGASAGLGAYLFLTNAQSVSQLSGPFQTYSVNVGIGIAQISVQLSVGGGIWELGVSPPFAGATAGASASKLTTTTVATGGGCH
jgi:RHS repeat-associated protein